MLAKYPDKVKLVFKNFPLRNHKYAKKAAKAALAAHAQGKFWEFHDLLFKNYNKLNDKKIDEIISKLKLDKKAIYKKMKARKIQAIIQKDLDEGVKASVRGTPTIYINGKLLRVRSLEGFKSIIEKELTKLTPKS